MRNIISYLMFFNLRQQFSTAFQIISNTYKNNIVNNNNNNRYSRNIHSMLKFMMITESLGALKFDNRNIRNLPVDKEMKNFPRQTKHSIFSKCLPTPVDKPELMAISKDALELIGIKLSNNSEAFDISNLSSEEKKLVEDYFSGNVLLPGSEPAAHCYCGHQFGSFAGQLGDGAAISLGEVVKDENDISSRYELQLKGAGATPFSRTADGRKVLRSSVREFLCSEAMFYLDIPTTRAATLITSSSTVQRDPFYDGNILDEKCTIVGRIAPNFFRFGSFEIFKSTGNRLGPSAGNEILQKKLLDHVLTYYPSIDRSSQSDEESYGMFFTEIVKRTAELVAK